MTKKQVQEFVLSMNIQLDNFVQFLPQDMVKEFPTLGPRQLLERTQRALGDGLMDRHRELIALTKGVLGEKGNVDKMLTELDSLKEQACQLAHPIGGMPACTYYSTTVKHEPRSHHSKLHS